MEKQHIILKSNNIEKCKLPNPNDKTVTSDRVNNLWCQLFDINKYTKILHNFIYEDDSKFYKKYKQTNVKT